MKIDVNGESRLVLVRERWPHMSEVSGIDPLFLALERILPIPVGNFSISDGLRTRRFDLISKWQRRERWQRGNRMAAVSPSTHVSVSHEMAMESAVARLRKERNAHLLLSSGEAQVCGSLLAAGADVRSRVIACFHQPPSWFRLNWKDFSVLRTLGGSICFSDSQRAYLEAVTGGPVEVIRHGVNSEFFCPSEKEVNKVGRKILFVGHWLRDWAILRETFEQVFARIDVEMDCVVPWNRRGGEDAQHLARNPKVKWHASISAEKLRELYREADLLFVPLIDGGVNNAVVEGLACGLPIVSTKVGAMEDYVTDDIGELGLAGDTKSHVDAVLRLLSDCEAREKARAMGRQFATSELNWDRIATDLWKQLEQWLPRMSEGC